MRNFPREIEADLLCRGIDIHDWHQGKPNLTSRRLLVLIDHLPDDSAYQRERRDGDWSEAEYIAATIANYTIMARVDEFAKHEQKLKVPLFESPAQRRNQQELDDKVAALRAHVTEQMRRGSGG